MKVTLRTISRSAQFICVQTTPGQKAGKGPELVKKLPAPIKNEGTSIQPKSSHYMDSAILHYYH